MYQEARPMILLALVGGPPHPPLRVEARELAPYHDVRVSL